MSAKVLPCMSMPMKSAPPIWTPDRVGVHGRFATGAGGMGHMVVCDAGVDASYRFYTEVLGLRGSVESRVQVGDVGVEITFLHCNDRDHTVAFGVWPMMDWTE